MTFCLSQNVIANDIVYFHGIKLAASQVREQGQLVEVSVSEDPPVLVNKSDLPSHVALGYAKSENLFSKLSIEDQKLFCRTSIQEKASEPALFETLLLTILSVNNENINTDCLLNVDESQFNYILTVIVKNLDSVKQSKFMPRFIIEAVVRNPLWVREHGVGIIYANIKEISSYGVQKIIDISLKGQIKEANDIFSLLSEFQLFGNEERNNIAVILLDLQDVYAGDDSKYKTLIQVLDNSDSRIKDVAMPIIYNKALGRGKELIEKHRNKEAVTFLLSSIPSKLQSPKFYETLKLGFTAVNSSKDAEDLLTLRNEIINVINSDSTIGEKLYPLLVNRVKEYINANDFGSAELLLKSLSELPGFLESKLAKIELEKLISKYAFSGDIEAVNNIVKIQPDISILLSAKFFLIVWKVAWCSPLIFIILLALLLVVRRRNQKAKLAKKAAQSKPKVEPLFPEKKDSDEEFTSKDELTLLLEELGLEKEADVTEIKHAYRQKLKLIHPDSQVGAVAKMIYDRTDELMRLKSVYERILQLKK